MVDETRPRLVGLIPEDRSVRLRAGAILCDADRPPEGHGQGLIVEADGGYDADDYERQIRGER